MDFEIIEFKIDPCKMKLARIVIDYHGLMMRCDLVYYAKGHKAWVRMPERWFNPSSKTSYCYWPTKEKSDEFQKEVLNKIFDRYDLNIEKVAELHRSAYEKKVV